MSDASTIDFKVMGAAELEWRAQFSPEKVAAREAKERARRNRLSMNEWQDRMEALTAHLPRNQHR